MNRREMLGVVTKTAAACGIGGTAKAVDAEPKPLVLVLTVPGRFDKEARRRLREEWHRVHSGDDLPPLVILPEGFDLKAVRPQPG